MTEFDKAVKHVKTCLFWDFVDGQWLNTLYTPIDRDYFNRLMQNIVEAHESENAKLRELVRDMFRDFANADYELKRNHGRTFMAVTRYEPRLQDLGIEVDE